MKKIIITIPPTKLMIDAMSLAVITAKMKPMATQEIKNLIDELFACSVPYSTPLGKQTFVTYSNEELERKFKI